MKFFMIILGLLFSLPLYSQIGKKVSDALYSHGTIGLTAGSAISSSSVDTQTMGWKICHDADSSATYLAISTGVDPTTDGIRIGPNTCYDCVDCSAKTLIEANVKAQAAGTGYSVIQFK